MGLGNKREVYDAIQSCYELASRIHFKYDLKYDILGSREIQTLGNPEFWDLEIQKFGILKSLKRGFQ